jgi:hypothetical protein
MPSPSNVVSELADIVTHCLLKRLFDGVAIGLEQFFLLTAVDGLYAQPCILRGCR